MKLHLRNALITSSIAGVLFLSSCLYSFYAHTSSFYSIADFVAQFLFFVGLFWSIKELREKVTAGYLDIRSGTLCGLQYSVLFSFVFSLFVIAQFLIPGFMDFLGQLSKEAFAKQGGITDDEITKRIAEMRLQYTPFKVFTMSVFKLMLTGILFSLVISMLLRNKN